MTSRIRCVRNDFSGVCIRRQAALAVLTVACLGSMALAQGLVYVDAVDQSYGAGPPATNLFQANGNPLPADGSTILDPFTGTAAPSNSRWDWRGFGVPSGGFATVYESQQEDSPEVRMTLTGLNNATTYDVYAVYWSDRGNDWNIRAGFADATISGNPALTVFDRTAASGATAGSLGSSAAWTTPPADNPTDNDPTVANRTDDNTNPFVDHTPGDPVSSTRDMYLGKIGAATPVGGKINVWLDDLPSTTNAGQRSWIEGLAYVPTNTQVFATATIDRATGHLTVTNPTGIAFPMTSVSITSTGGSLNATTWTTITSGGAGVPGAGWSVTAPASPGTTPSTTALTETKASGSTPFPAVTGSLDFGNVWLRTPIQDLQIAITLSDTSVVTITPSYSGTAIRAGDFTGAGNTPDGAINSLDYIALIGGLQKTFATAALAYAGGDITGDGLVNRLDVVQFRNVFTAANGAGSFDRMLSSLGVPEPSTIMLSALAGGLIFLARGRRQILQPRVLVRKLSDMTHSPKSTSMLVVLTAALLCDGLLFERAGAVAVGTAANPWMEDTLVTPVNPNPILNS
ncbi:MAG TPA: PEP-CTERM sorting domain-containing protein, partial [Lacipirellulaceae bacterium]